MKVLVMKPWKEPEVQEIKEDQDTLKQMQQIVDGYIVLKMVSHKDFKGITIVCNEDGIPFGLEMNRGIYGTFFYIRLDENNDFKSLTDEDIEDLKEFDYRAYGF